MFQHPLQRRSTSLVSTSNQHTSPSPPSLASPNHSCLSTANFFRSARSTILSAFSFVAFKKIFGTIFSPSFSRGTASNASSHRLAQRHHLQPPLIPPMLRKSLPWRAVKSRNSSVTSAATLWLPKSPAGTYRRICLLGVVLLAFRG